MGRSAVVGRSDASVKFAVVFRLRATALIIAPGVATFDDPLNFTLQRTDLSQSKFETRCPVAGVLAKSFCNCCMKRT
ncbi:hypothetical protein K239x_17630 [Planctomycetes bacterium K23_9]|uniref:Uncharacterized protein n=1 Tax=Stieleria marina TaxID=1930275 RepID=A0A517NRR0_9BACT|nr:hypothetical protein K239x_17630 [Planctomycetes bacterium K23_9]